MELFYLQLAGEVSSINIDDSASQYSDGISRPIDGKSTKGVEPWATPFPDEMGHE